MTFDPYARQSRPPVSKDDWYPKPSNGKKNAKKRRLILLPNRKYFRYKGTMKRVRKQPDLPKQCVVMRYRQGDGEGIADPCGWLDQSKTLFSPTMSGDGYVFPSKIKAKKAVWHTVMQSDKPGSHVDYKIVEI